VSLYRFAVANVVTVWDGQKVVLQKGEAWWAADPFVKSRPDLFADEPTVVKARPRATTPPVEAASAAPGEKRTTRRAKA
jgi:hypothetical protein